jgi:hypothetical protein
MYPDPRALSADPGLGKPRISACIGTQFIYTYTEVQYTVLASFFLLVSGVNLTVNLIKYPSAFN